jgi:hypothetical protein
MEPIDYKVPLPAGRNLRISRLADGSVRVERDTVGTVALLREAFLPLAAVVLALVVIGPNVYALTTSGRPWSEPLSIVRLFLIACAAAWLVWILRGAAQNVGIVTLVTVGRDTLHWRKQNLWGPREFFWPASTIKAIRVRSGFLVEPSLVVERRDGRALIAFAFHNVDELHEAAAALTSALSGGGPSARDPLDAGRIPRI